MAGKKPWYEDDDFWAKTAPFMFSAGRWEAAESEVDNIIALTGVEPGARVLDMPCGPGRHTLEFARRGFRVTGVDRTQSYLNTAQTKADEAELDIELVCSDMREFVRPDTFDVALNLYTSIGYFEDPDDDRKVVSNLCESLRPAGVLIVDLMGKEILARIFRPSDWVELDDSSIVLEERILNPDWGSMNIRWIVLRDGERTDFSLWMRLYAATELMALLRDAGFSDVSVYADFEGSPYNHKANRLVAVARK